MSSKSKSNPLNGAHTAGIFSDLSVDGPVIGTLVLVVDRAKNLPNRKTIGKQDPYCAARLGKEAKKTNTDIRGGQTPRWYELRFTVHDSPDYYQLKLSVFSDDKKTELIGENWVDLRDILVAGGGQSDKWQSLNCRGKYAGEIRIEITYYDSRPKPKQAAPAAVSAPTTTAASNTGSARGRPTADTGGPNTMGPRAPTGPKRRPLPSDPVTGQPPVQPQPAAQSAPSPGPPAPTPQAAPAAAPAAVPSPGFVQQQQLPQHMQTPPRQSYTPNQSPLPSANNYSYNSSANSPAPVTPAGQYQDYHDRDPYMAGDDTRYESTPPAVQHQQHHGHQSQQSHYSVHSPHSHSHDRSQYGSRDFTPDNAHHHQQHPSYDQQQQDSGEYHFDGAPAHSMPPAMPPSFQDPNYAQPADDRPPPPPAHRSRNNSSGAPGTDSSFRTSFNSSTQKDGMPAMRRDVLRNEAHRHSVSTAAYPGRPTYRPADASPVSPGSLPDQTYQPPAPRNLSHSASYDGQYGSEFDNTHESSSFRKSGSRPVFPSIPQQQQPEPPHQEQSNYDYDSQGFENAPSPAPLNLGSHRASFSASPAPLYSSSAQSQHRQSDAGQYVHRSPSPMTPHDYGRRSPSPLPTHPVLSSYDSYDGQDDPYQSNHNEPDATHHRDNPDAYMLPAVPASLVPGVPSSLALELRSRIHSEDRREPQLPQPPPQQRRYTSAMDAPPQATPPRGRQMLEDPSPASLDYDYNKGSQVQTYSTPQRSQFSQSYSTPPQPVQPPQPRYDHSPGPYSSGVPSPAVVANAQGASPKPQHTIKRKSVSPAPPAASPEGERRLSGIPFGPDSYDSLNPALAASKDLARPDYNEASGKIIAHDGREIDPSDHLPVESWAPEPEPKPSNPASATASPADYSTPTSGRKQLRIAGRPQSSMGSSGVTFSSADDPGTTYTPTARNRLQKKANRQSVAAISVSSGTLSSGSPQGSTPLAPLTYPRQQQDSFTPPRPLGRASTFDYPSENHAPSTYGSGPGRTSFGSPAPPIPAKVPVGSSQYNGASHTGSFRGNSSYGYDDSGDRCPVMSGALMPTGPATRALPWNDNSTGGGMHGGPGEIALLEEMSRIDIGTGRARRHQGR
ncbi:uncharacterized protein SPSK_03913 [Sporothrix schenckii 1099-18]|uniref:C2 domain-containing protein n=1 Tax=Sporothrix schenckii 1099-18 TaxID=1397361 RepID=A0A0F2LZG8_SPOSC|nr:uncharacterized protein SPSK_03913 [Sporothrix schenckii 1099-18]KJR82853.1 hypothetical protein SPSK_03913 [Sporothrix schenckii 1099-18]